MVHPAHLGQSRMLARPFANNTRVNGLVGGLGLWCGEVHTARRRVLHVPRGTANQRYKYASEACCIRAEVLTCSTWLSQPTRAWLRSSRDCFTLAHATCKRRRAAHRRPQTPPDRNGQHTLRGQPVRGDVSYATVNTHLQSLHGWRQLGARPGCAWEVAAGQAHATDRAHASRCGSPCASAGTGSRCCVRAHASKANVMHADAPQQVVLLAFPPHSDLHAEAQ